jgi:hypothetical protein
MSSLAATVLAHDPSVLSGIQEGSTTLLHSHFIGQCSEIYSQFPSWLCCSADCAAVRQPVNWHVTIPVSNTHSGFGWLCAGV